MSLASMPADLRCSDLIARTAGVNLRSTMRVLLALDAISHAYKCEMDEVIDQCSFLPSRPSPENVASCSHASFELEQAARTDDTLRHLVTTIRQLQ